jgi:hypothetical protein
MAGVMVKQREDENFDFFSETKRFFTSDLSTSVYCTMTVSFGTFYTR